MCDKESFGWLIFIFLYSIYKIEILVFCVCDNNYKMYLGCLKFVRENGNL